jgi:hypothetical protein
LTGHTRSSRRLPYSEVGPGPVDLEAVASMADLAAAAAVIAGPLAQAVLLKVLARTVVSP